VPPEWWRTLQKVMLPLSGRRCIISRWPTIRDVLQSWLNRSETTERRSFTLSEQFSVLTPERKNVCSARLSRALRIP
jgi:hypothetical protein